MYLDKMSDTTYLSQLRGTITELTKQLAEISKNIQDNIAVVRDKEEELKNIDVTRGDLSKKLQVSSTDLKIEEIDHPQMGDLDRHV